jgi:hypothetical protein
MFARAALTVYWVSHYYENHNRSRARTLGLKALAYSSCQRTQHRNPQSAPDLAIVQLRDAV